MKFKIRLKAGECSNETNLSACRVNVEESEENKLEFLTTTVISKFKNFGLTEDNFDLYWQDSDGDSNIISDNDDLLLAHEELNGPLYEIIACLNSIVSDGIISKFINIFVGYVYR